jgi:hypothetical protein
MPANDTTGRRPEKTVMTHEVPGRAADQGTLYAALGLRLPDRKDGHSDKQCTRDRKIFHFGPPWRFGNTAKIGRDLCPP